MHPELLNIYADRGNVAVFERRAAWRGLDLIVRPVGEDEPLPPDTDLVYIGGGQDRDQRLIADDVAARASELDRFVDGGGALLAVCGGYQLLGRSYRDAHGRELPGAGVFPLETVAGASRLIGDVLLECTLGDAGSRTLAGFENHAGRTLLDPRATPLGRVVYGFGNDGESGYEGCRRANAVGTYLHGPLLPRNPWLADWLLERALEHHAGPSRTLSSLDDALEIQAHEVARQRARSRGGRP